MSTRPNQQSRPTSTNATPADKAHPIFQATSPNTKSTGSIAKGLADSVRKSPSSIEKYFQTGDAPQQRGNDKRSPIENQPFSGRKSDTKLVSRDQSTAKKNPASEPRSGLKVPPTFLNPKSAEKDAERKSNPGSERREGKLSSHSENVAIGKRSNMSRSPIPEDFNEAHLSPSELKRNLNRILEDKDAKVKMTATETASGKKSSKEKKSIVKGNQGSDKKGKRTVEAEETRVKAEDSGEVAQEEGQENQAEGTSGVARKEYSLYEDWRIIQTVEELMKKETPSLSSRTFWGKVIDPSTGNRLLDDKRSSESLRDRWKRYLSNLDEAGKETIEEWLENHSVEEMKNHYCVWKKIDGEKQFTGITAQLSYNPERMQRKTPYNAKSNKQSKNEKPYKKKGEGRVEDSFEDQEKEEIIGQHLEEEFRGDENLLNAEEIEEFTSMQIEYPREGEQRSRGASKQKPVRISSTTMTTKANYSEIPSGYSGQAPVRQIRKNIQPRTNFEEEKDERVNYMPVEKGSKKRKSDEYERGSTTAQVNIKDLKRVRLNEEYDDRTLQPSIMFSYRKPCENRRLSDGGRMEEEDLMVYVDLNRGFRQFVKFDREDERRRQEDSLRRQEDERKRQENVRLNRLADKYHFPLNEVAVAFRKVSYDYADLEEYLQKKDPRILWTEEEDTDLIENNQTAIKYLRLIKGDEKVRKRKEYLDRVLA